MSGTALTVAAVLLLALRPECGSTLGVDPARIAAVAKVESGLNPLAIHVNGPGGGQEINPATVEEARSIAADLVARHKSIDVGLMQINSAELRGLSIQNAFDACANMAAGATHMAEDFDAVWGLAHRRYNCGRTDCSARYASLVQNARAEILSAPAVASSVVAVTAQPLACPSSDPTGWHVAAVSHCSVSAEGWHVKAATTLEQTR